jgi:hypothetical protein
MGAFSGDKGLLQEDEKERVDQTGIARFSMAEAFSE